ncbi:biliverdin-producing heme oxygenase [Corynebacterium flavescens]|uniref:biliverdin-producing heme oxygenase n=1 Tax=Corynebacterium flavescens TaxID=28028 RepID=UPI003FD52C14
MMTIAMERTSLAQPLSDALYKETVRAHMGAGVSHLGLTPHSAGNRGLSVYRGQLWFIYEALERSARAVAGTEFGSLIFGYAGRSRRELEQDLEGTWGGNWRERLRLLPATAAYVARLEETADAEFSLQVLAQHCARCVGDYAVGVMCGPGSAWIDSLRLGEGERAQFMQEVATACKFSALLSGEIVRQRRHIGSHN